VSTATRATLHYDAWNQLRGWIYRACGVVLEEHQAYLMVQRLEPVALDLGMTSVDELVRAACGPAASSRFAHAIVDAMTTHETSFFRDPPFWTMLERSVLPALFARSGPRPLRIWSAACSTGQEAYSLAMLLAERWPQVLEGTQIVASDVSEPVVMRARRANFSLVEVQRGLTPARLAAHFEPVADGYRVRGRLRALMHFVTHNLIGNGLYPGTFDLVLVRNVLIYFAEADRVPLLARIARALAPGGFVGVGATEILAGVAGLGFGWYGTADLAAASSSCPKCRLNGQMCPEHSGR
jgi:chemotaxis protein methyltransferase CheR